MTKTEIVEQKEHVELPAPILEKLNKLMPKIKAELAKDKDSTELYKFIEQVQFGPIESFSESAMEMPTFVFVINEGEVRPFPATQMNDREIVIDFGMKYENQLKKVYGDSAQEDPRRQMLRKKFFVGVDAHKLILPREFFVHPGVEPSKDIPKFIHARVFKMYMNEPFVRNFFTNDIVNKAEKWELLVEQNIAERIDFNEEITDGFIQILDEEGRHIVRDGKPLYTPNTKILHHKYQIKEEFLVSADKPVYDINSFDFVKSEFFEQEFSKMIVVGIRALYEEFDKQGPSVGWYIAGIALFVIIQDALLLYFIPGIINASKAAPTAIRLLLHVIGI